MNYRKLAGKTTRRLPKPAAKAVRKIVKAEISRNSEDKMISIFTSQDHNAPISAGDFYQLVPNIQYGTDSFERIGDVIRPKRLTVKVRVRLGSSYWSNTYARVVPIQVRFLILKQKTIKTSAQLTAWDYSHLLRANIGSSAELPFNGTPTDMMSPINRDLFEVLLDKKIWLRPQDIAAATSSTNTYPLEANLVEFTKVIKCPAKLTFDDGNTTSPNNFAPFACLGYGLADGNSGGSVQTPVTCDILSMLTFEDS